MSCMSTKTARLDARCNEEIKATIATAATLIGLSVSDFLISTTLPKAREIIKSTNAIRLNDRQREVFLKTISDPSEPSEALKLAQQEYLSRVEA